MNESLDFSNVQFTFSTLSAPLISGLSVRFPTGWTGIVGPNGAGKSTILRLAVGEIAPLSGQIHRPPAAIYCPQRTDEPPPHLDAFLEAADGLAAQLRGRLGLGNDWLARWHTLSHGERKRAQIGVALWQQPAVLAIDEPSNHIDADARDLLAEELRAFAGIGLLVSHDRELLDELCGQCLFVDPPDAVLRPGGYSKGHDQQLADEERTRQLHEQAKAQVRRVDQEMAQRRELAAKEHKTRSKRGLAKNDHDSRARINRARLMDSKAGAPLRQLQGRSDQAAAHLAGIHAKKEVELGIWLPESRARCDRLFQIPAGTLILGAPEQTAAAPSPPRQLQYPDLAMAPDSRVALTGPNGAGKSTLVRHILAHLQISRDRVTYLPQELAAEQSRQILTEVRQLSGQKLGQLMNAVSRMGSKPQRLLETELPSPGETRKLLLALGIVRATHLIVLDEPTNHLDLPSIQCLEAALAACPAGLLLVSHDRRFLHALAKTCWEIQLEPATGNSQLIIRRHTTP